MRVVGIIPARYKSSRFPGKPLASILGKPLVIRVAEIVSKKIDQEDLYIATDDKRIKTVVEKYGFNVIMTPTTCKTGTDRVYEASKLIEADIYINIQGDEPVINPNDIQLIIDSKKKNFNHVVNGYCQIKENEDPSNTDLPKVVMTSSNRLLYMSRLPIPGNKTALTEGDFNKQVCIYGFNSHELKLFASTDSKTPIEAREDIEILRFLELDYPVFMVKVSRSSIAVDRPEDVERVELELKKMGYA
ncbi:MAG: 3-deoxy-manno-octulosonate cytidylyltransferase [Bacteroidota bacterium]